MTRIEQQQEAKRKWWKEHSSEIAERRNAKRNENRSEFNKAARERYKLWRSANREIAKARGRKNYASRKTAIRNQIFKSKYGITAGDYMRMYFLQGGKCAVCFKVCADIGKEGLAVDHDHKSGRVRGLLCLHCNTAIGSFKEPTISISQALEYLQT